MTCNVWRGRHPSASTATVHGISSRGVVLVEFLGEDGLVEDRTI
uniref:Uncharacterized protein n=1 Tax=Rhizobium meliloti TaxID=382 RepID=I2E2C7_RHIML|nr:short hypothetical protein [Sinorhizobium meliloti]